MVWIPVIVAIIGAVSAGVGAVFNFLTSRLMSQLNVIKQTIDDVDKRVTVIESDVSDIRDITWTNRGALKERLRHDIQELITTCIIKGYRSMRDTNEVGSLYEQYSGILNGNGTVKNLYEEDFLDLPIQEEGIK